MNNDRRFEITNKIITTEQIIELADYLIKTCNYYLELNRQDLEKNNNSYFSGGQYSYYMFTKPEVKYKIRYTDDRTIETTDENMLKEALDEPQYVKEITESLNVTYNNNIGEEKKEMRMSVFINFAEKYIYYSSSDKNMEEEAYNFNSYIREILERGEDRYSGVVKNKFSIKVVVGLALGSILTLIAFFLLLVLRLNGNDTLGLFFSNGFILPLLGWIIAFVFGTIIAGPITDNLYKEIDGAIENVYIRGKNKEKFEEEYTKRNEILIGKNSNNLIKRKEIEKIYNISKKIVLVRLGISLIIMILLSIFHI